MKKPLTDREQLIEDIAEAVTAKITRFIFWTAVVVFILGIINRIIT